MLLLGSAGNTPATEDRIEGITRLEKLVFLLHRETPVGELISEDPDFKPYNFGPFSKKLYEAIDILRMAGLVTEQSSSATTPDDLWESEEVVGVESSDPYATRDISLTDEGKRYYTALMADLPGLAQSTSAYLGLGTPFFIAGIAVGWRAGSLKTTLFAQWDGPATLARNGLSEKAGRLLVTIQEQIGGTAVEGGAIEFDPLRVKNDPVS